MTESERDKQAAFLITKAWSDESFKRNLIADPAATLKAEGIGVPEGLEVRVVENTDAVYHFVIPAKSRPLSDADLDTVAAGTWTWVNGVWKDLVAGRDGC